MSPSPRAVPVLRVIVGPTSAGKSPLALALAEAVGASIVSADSRQVYRHFSIGTAKPTPDEQRRVPHYGLDIAEPTQRVSADAWARRVPVWVSEIESQAGAPLVVGGTGFYLRALFEPLFDAPDVDESRRLALGRLLDELPTDELRRWCKALDPDRAGLGRTQLLRAVETALLTGERLSALHQSRSRAAQFAARYLLVDPGPELAGRISARVRAMLADGWLDEVAELVKSVPADAPAWTATGYDSLRDVVLGRGNLDDAVERVVVATRQYAKRQRTWFRHQLGGTSVIKLNPADPDAVVRAIAWWHGEES